MEADHHRLDCADPARLEKQLDSDRASTAPSLRHSDAPPGGAQDAIAYDRKFLSEEEALQHARQHPDDEQPVYLTYSFNDRDNPRNWPKWKKWYITCFVSMLNVLTYVASPTEYARACREFSDHKPCTAASVPVGTARARNSSRPPSTSPLRSAPSGCPCTSWASPWDP